MKVDELKPKEDSSIEDLIRSLKIRVAPAPDMDSAVTIDNSGGYLKQFDPKQHRVMDKTLRPDKEIKDNNGQFLRWELVARISLSLQKIIVERAVAFAFGNPVKIVAEPKEGIQTQILEGVKKVLHDNKSFSFDRKLDRKMSMSTEVAEYWYTVPNKSSKKDLYGFSSERKIKGTIFSPAHGDKLFPYFDATGDLVAFSREFVRYDADNKQITYFETFTDEEKILWQSSKSGSLQWEEVSKEPITIGKMPIVYGRKDQVDWEDVQPLIERLEKLLSNFGDTNDYHASPKIFVQGKLKGFAQKGEAGAILEGEKDTKAEYLSWQHAPESVKLEIETLLRLIYSLTQTPDISFESIKGLGEISGIALKLLFMDAHLKVKNKEEIYTEYFQRRYKIILAYLGELNNSWKGEAEEMELEPQMTPFMIDDEKSLIEFLTTANGNKQVISRKTSIKLSGLVKDVDAEETQIKQEEAEASKVNLFEHTV